MLFGLICTVSRTNFLVADSFATQAEADPGRRESQMQPNRAEESRRAAMPSGDFTQNWKTLTNGTKSRCGLNQFMASSMPWPQAHSTLSPELPIPKYPPLDHLRRRTPDPRHHNPKATHNCHSEFFPSQLPVGVDN